MIKLKNNITGVEFSKYNTLLCTEDKTYLTEVPELSKNVSFRTFDNPTGVCAISKSSDCKRVAMLGENVVSQSCS